MWQLLFSSAYAKQYTGVWDEASKSPRTIKWRSFYKALDYPAMSDPVPPRARTRRARPGQEPAFGNRARAEPQPAIAPLRLR